MRHFKILSALHRKVVMPVYLFLLGVLSMLSFPVLADGLTDAEYKSAIDHMQTEPKDAEMAMRQRNDLLGKLDLLLFLHTYRHDESKIVEEIKLLKAALDDAAVNGEGKDDYLIKSLGAPEPYDRSDNSLIATIQILSGSAQVITHPRFYAIPCAILLRRSGLLDATATTFSGNRANFAPRSGCHWNRGGEIKGFPEKSILYFMKLSERADGNFLATHEGTNRFSIMANQMENLERAKLAPESLWPAPQYKNRPYETWSYLSLYNRRAFSQITPGYNSALRKLEKYYVTFGRSDKNANELARRALFSISIGSDCGYAPPHSLRTLLLDGAPLAKISQMASKKDSRQSKNIFASCSPTIGFDPLPHVAVARPETLPVLASLRPSFDVNARNPFNKTPLMTAAQINSLESVSWLLSNGADVNAVTGINKKLVWPYKLKHNQRTALHYAAASAGLPVLKALIAAGANIAAKDDKGLGVIDYLNGHGPVNLNPVLTPKQRSAAIELISKGLAK